MKFSIIATFLMLSLTTFAQSDLENVIKAGQVLLSGFTILKTTNADSTKDSKTISSICVKNRMQEKITFLMSGKDLEGVAVTKELVVQNDGKECVFNIPKGIYAYQVQLANKEIYKKGEYNFDDDVIIVVKKEN